MSGFAPGIWLALLVGVIYGALAHLMWGRQWRQLGFFVAAGIAGCLLTLLVGIQVAAQLPAPGGLPLVEATVVAWLLLGGVAVLGRT